jgi:hypothetical protein
MGDEGREPSTERISMLLRLTRIALGIWQNVPPSLHSTGDNMRLLMVLAGYEYDTGKDEALILVRGWPDEVGTALGHLRELSREWASRWGLTPVRQWGGHVMAPGGGPMPEHPFLATEDEVALLSNLELVLASALARAAEREGERPPLKVFKAPAPGNDERDRFIYDERSKKPPTAWKEIISAINRRPGWAHFDHDTREGRLDAAGKALDRYCKRHPELPIPKRDHGKNRRK